MRALRKAPVEGGRHASGAIAVPVAPLRTKLPITLDVGMDGGGGGTFMVDVGPLRDESGEVIGGVAISRDVTAVRQLEA